MELLFNLSELNELLESFYNISNLRIAIFNNKFHEIASYPTGISNYCEILRCDENINNKCKKCDYDAYIQCKTTGKIHIYNCHLGLTEVIAPIYSSNLIIGYIMFGQVLCNISPSTYWNNICTQLEPYNINLNMLYEEFKNIKNISSSTIKSYCKILEICANYLYSAQKLKLKENTLAYSINDYINSNICEELSISTLCNHFNIRKTTFCKLCNEYYGMGIAEHIRKIRLQKSKEYLIDTNLNISEISTLVGINDYNYFSKIFKLETGMTPREFRKLNSMSNLN